MYKGTLTTIHPESGNKKHLEISLILIKI
jgi:hypothetical protein